MKVPQFSGTGEKQTEMRQRFLREARAAAAVDHPFVCKIYDVGEQDGTPFVVMAFIEGPTLADRLTKFRRVSDRSAVAVTLRIAEALMAVHAHGIIHRDLKPANILMPKDSTPILTDFGLAHIHAAPEHLTGEGAILGTPAYMAPEQVLTDLGAVTTRTDLYSLGVVMYQMLTSRLPLEGNAMQIIAMHVAQKLGPPASQLRPGLDPALDAILHRAMAYRPEDRYPDVAAFTLALKDWLKASAARREEPVVSMSVALDSTSTTPGPELTHPPPLPPTEALTVTQPPLLPVKGKPRRRWVWRVAALLIMAGGGAFGMYHLREKPVKDETQAEDSLAEKTDKGRNTPTELPREDDKPKDDKKPTESAQPDQPRLLLDEDFRKAFDSKHALPDGWKSEKVGSLSVMADETGTIPDKTVKQRPALPTFRPHLQVNQRTGDHFITPPLSEPLKDDFFIEGEFVLGAYHTLTIQMTPGKGAVLPVTIYYDGTTTLAADLPTAASKWEYYKSHRFRIEREGKAVLVYLDGKRLTIKEFPELASFDTIRIGLTAGSNSTKAKLYNLKVSTLPK